MNLRRRVPPVLAEQAIVPLVVALAFGLGAAFGIITSIVGANEARAFEERSVIVPGTVLADGATLADGTTLTGDDFQVPVEFTVDGMVRAGLAPVSDRGPYEAGEQLPVRYDPRDPRRVELVEQPYDLATPLAFSLGLAVLAIAVLVGALWRPWRLIRLASAGAPTYAFRGRIGREDRRYLRDRQWVLLDALDTDQGAPPVAAVPLLRSQALPAEGPFDVLVRGTVRDGGRAVVLAGERVLWPSGRVRVGSLPGVATD